MEAKWPDTILSLLLWRPLPPLPPPPRPLHHHHPTNHLQHPRRNVINLIQLNYFKLNYIK